MNIGAIIAATVLVAAVGLFIGVFLGVAGKKFAVEVDEKEVAVREALPGNNCGGCGYPGCDGLAAAIAKGEAPVKMCIRDRFRIDIVRDEEFETAVKEFAKTGQDSDAVSGLIAYTSHNENEIYTIDYSNRFTAQVLYRLDYKWPVTDDRYLENAIAALDRLTFFD